MHGISQISSEQNIMVVAFPAVRQSESGPADYLSPFAAAGVNVDISLLVAAEDEDTALNALREAFGL